MTSDPKILPGTGRGTATRSGVVEGSQRSTNRDLAARWDPSTTAFGGGPPPRSGEEL